VAELDSTEKGGVLGGIVDKHVVPVKFIGLDEAQDALAPLDPAKFTRALFEPYETDLAWLGRKGYHGIPIIISLSNDYGAAFRARIEELVAQETEDFLVQKHGSDKITRRETGAPHPRPLEH